MSPTLIIIVSLIALFLLHRIRQWYSTRSLRQYTPAEAQRSSKAIFLDVRTRGERSEGAIKGSIHIPLNELARRIDELKAYREREIICYCQSGSRSMTAASLLHRQGFNAANLKGGIAEWNFQNLRSS